MRRRSRLGANWLRRLSVDRLGYNWLSQLMHVLGLALLYWLYRLHSASKCRVIADGDVVGLVYRYEHEKQTLDAGRTLTFAWIGAPKQKDLSVL